MKNIYFKAILLFSSIIFFSVCKKQEAPPEELKYSDNPVFAKFPYHKTSISLQSDIKVNYNDVIVGSALSSDFTPGDLYCRMNTLFMFIPFSDDHPGKYPSAPPYFSRNFYIQQIPFKIGKTKLAKNKFNNGVDCRVDTLPFTHMFWSEVWKNEVLGLTDYSINPQDDNFVELTAVDTIVKREILGNIKIKFLQDAPRSKAYPDTINITASFKIDW